MSLHTKVVFPTPPPTTNALTPQQRIQLVRKTRKIEQIFGTTPYLLDSPIETLGPFHVHFPSQVRSSTDGRAKTRSFSMDSSSSESSSGSPVSISRSLSLSKASSNARPGSAIIRNSEDHSRPSTPSSIEVQESWPISQTKPPVLRLAIQSPLETIPASPDPTTTTFNMEPISQALDSTTPPLPPSSSSSRSSTFLFGVAEEPSSPQSASFIIPSRTSLRKQKMDRLRKKLGCEVPLNLMLSQVDDCEDSDISPSPPASPTSRHQYSTLNSNYSATSDDHHSQRTAPIPRMRKPTTTGKIAGARDSIGDTTLSVKIHKAKRHIRNASAGPLGLIKKGNSSSTSKKVPKTPEPLPTPPRALVISSPTDFRRVKEKLSLIIESPEEHGTGCSEEFGLSRVSTRSNSSTSLGSRSAVSLFDTANADVKMWSTRRGYEGWRPNTPPSEASSSPPTTPSSTMSSSSLVKRSPSYRKPVPAVMTTDSI